ncbi:MAG: rhodanese-like domain-containing protein [Pyrinomonadaceae bacterium]
MDEIKQIQIISFYEFKELAAVGALATIKASLKDALIEFDVRGTIIIANEGYNGMVCGGESQIKNFVAEMERILGTTLVFKSSFNEKAPFRKFDVKIKPEIVTLKKTVDVSLGNGTHIKPADWNDLIADPGTLVLDARNDYEYKTGTFRRAINPDITKFSELPSFVAENLDPEKHKRIAMFCTGGIRCEKFAPFMKQMGFEEVYQLEGGILKYLEETPVSETLWEGECFVFDERVTVDASLQKGTGPDHSQRLEKRKKQQYKAT